MHLSKLSEDFDRCRINPELQEIAFDEWQSLPKKHGCYSIWQGHTCIYVGKAGGGTGLKGRFVHHDVKAYGKTKKGTTHPEGWIHYRTNWNKWNPASWRVEFFEASSEVHRTYLEGVMLLLFDPLCNNETFADQTSGQ
jgi:hypothetical protein